MMPPANQTPFPGVREVCDLVQQRGGLNIIVTHYNVESTQQLLDMHGLAHLFTGIFDVEQGYPCKPDPALLETAIGCFDLDRSETLVVGSRDIDIQAGHAAGVQTSLFGDARLPKPADQQNDHYCQLLKWLETQT